MGRAKALAAASLSNPSENRRIPSRPGEPAHIEKAHPEVTLVMEFFVAHGNVPGNFTLQRLGIRPTGQDRESPSPAFINVFSGATPADAIKLSTGRSHYFRIRIAEMCGGRSIREPRSQVVPAIQRTDG